MDAPAVQMIVAEPRIARIFAAARSREVIFSLMQSAKTTRSLAAELGLSFSLLHYHLARLVGSGLVRVVRHEKRAGPASAVYAVAAGSFLVLANAEPEAPTSALAGELQAALERARLRDGGTGTVYSLDADRMPSVRRLSRSDRTGEGEMWWRLHLDESDAKRLGREIGDLVATFRAKSRPTGRAYAVTVAFKVDEADRRHPLGMFDEAVEGPP